MRVTSARLGITLAALVGAGALSGACSSDDNPAQLGDTTGEAGGPTTFDPCATPTEGCPCSVEGTTAACGKVIAENGNYVTCSEGNVTCDGGKWGACAGDRLLVKSLPGQSVGTGGLRIQTTNPTCPNLCDPNGCQDTQNGAGDIDASGINLTEGDSGYVIVPTVGVGEGGTCTGLQCLIPACSGGTTTKITGTVYDPASLNPVYNALVMIPPSAASVVAVPAGVSSDPCGGATLPQAVSYAYTDTAGKFTLTNVPATANLPLVIQLGRWRRVSTLNTSSLTCGTSLNVSPASQCQGSYATTAACATRLPRTQSEGNIPHIAIATGGLDAIECMIYRMGVASSEFTDELGTGRVHVFDDGGSKLGGSNVNHDASYLLGFPCLAGDGNCPTPTVNSSNTTNITNPSFELLLAGWAASGASITSSIVAAEAGLESARLGNTVATNGDSTITQSFTAPAGANQLSLWFSGHCSDTVAYDWFIATLKDNTTGASATTSKVCPATTAWTNYTFPATAGDSFTLTLTSHDDNYVSDPLWTYVDNVQWQNTTVPNLLPNYDLVMLPCDGGGEYNSTNWGGSGPNYDDLGRKNLVNYAAVGGRIFTSHWGREWIERTSGAFASGPFPSVATWISDASDNNQTGVINSAATWGAPFNTWMDNLGAASGTPGTFPISQVRYDVSSVSAASRLFVKYQNNNDPADFTFDTPLGGTATGRVMFTDMHLANGTPSGTFPGNCPTQGSTLLQQEDAAEYLLFDLGACVSGLPIPGPVTQDFPVTFTMDYTAMCPAGTHVRWTELDWQDTLPTTTLDGSTPSGSSIVFGGQTADPPADGGTINWAAVQSATIATALTTTPGQPTNFDKGLIDTAPGGSGAFTAASPPILSASTFHLTVTLNPSSDAQESPALNKWQVIYDCPPAE